MIKIKKLAGIIAIGVVLASPLAAFAQPGGITNINPTYGNAPVTSLSGAQQTLTNIVNWVVIIFWILTVLFLVWAAVLYLTAAGNEEKIKEARQRVIYAVIAAVIALLANGLSGIVVNLLKGQ